MATYCARGCVGVRERRENATEIHLKIFYSKNGIVRRAERGGGDMFIGFEAVCVGRMTDNIQNL